MVYSYSVFVTTIQSAALKRPTLIISFEFGKSLSEIFNLKWHLSWNQDLIYQSSLVYQWPDNALSPRECPVSTCCAIGKWINCVAG